MQYKLNFNSSSLIKFYVNIRHVKIWACIKNVALVFLVGYYSRIFPVLIFYLLNPKQKDISNKNDINEIFEFSRLFIHRSRGYYKKKADQVTYSDNLLHNEQSNQQRKISPIRKTITFFHPIKCPNSINQATSLSALMHPLLNAFLNLSAATT